MSTPPTDPDPAVAVPPSAGAETPVNAPGVRPGVGGVGGTRPRRWKVGLALAAIFLCGGLVGALATVRFLQNGPRRNVDPARWSAMVLQDLDGRLHLSPGQRERIAPLVRAGAEEARMARRHAFGEAHAIIERTHARIVAELDDAQRPEFERFIAERHQRARRWLRRGPSPGSGGEFPPAPRP